MNSIGAIPDPLSAKQMMAGERVVGGQMGALRQQRDLEQNAGAKQAGDEMGKLKNKETEHTEEHHAESVELSDNASGQLEEAVLLNDDEAGVGTSYGRPGQQGEVKEHHHHSGASAAKFFKPSGRSASKMEEDFRHQQTLSGDDLQFAEESGVAPKDLEREHKTKKEEEAGDGLWQEEKEKQDAARSGVPMHHTVQDTTDTHSRTSQRKTDEQRIGEIKLGVPDDIHAAAKTMVANQIHHDKPTQALKELKTPEIPPIEIAAADYHPPLEIHDTNSGPLPPQFEEAA